jgi:hypothetical protein
LRHWREVDSGQNIAFFAAGRKTVDEREKDVDEAEEAERVKKEEDGKFGRGGGSGEGEEGGGW